MTAKEVYNYIEEIRQALDEYTAVYIEVLGKDENGELAGVEYDLNEIELIDGLLYLNGVIEIQDYEIAKVDHVNIKALKPVRQKGIRFILTENEEEVEAEEVTEEEVEEVEMLELVIESDVDRELLAELQSKHKNDLKGTYDLYDSLYVNNRCRSYNDDRIYYVAYVLSKNGIKVEVE